jgi:hypothetical protein
MNLATILNIVQSINMWLHKEKDFSLTLARLEQEGFAVKPFTIEGEECWLTYPPHMGIEWNEDNLIYRSAIWNSEGHPVSLSWKKFFNWDEQPELAPKPQNIEDCELMEKLDGSTLLVTMYKGHPIIRTRGSTSLENLDNGDEKSVLMEKYNTFFDMITQLPTINVTFVFEWTTPSNKIVLDYGDEPILWLTGIINHADYSYVSQDHLDVMAETFDFPRPKRWKFETLEDFLDAMATMKGVEGTCVYFNEGQDIKKVKTEEYLMHHSVKFKLGYKALVEMVFAEAVEIDEFKDRIEKRFDYEGLKFVEAMIETIYNSINWAKLQIKSTYCDLMNRNPADRKELAQIVFNTEPEFKEFSGFLFKMYEADDKNLEVVLSENESLRTKFKKLILEELEEK